MPEEPGPAEVATRSEIAELTSRAAAIGRTATAAVAVALARDIDAIRTSPTARSMAAGRHEEAMSVLRAMAPAESTQDELDDLHARRERRRTKGVAGAARGDLSG